MQRHLSVRTALKLEAAIILLIVAAGCSDRPDPVIRSNGRRRGEDAAKVVTAQEMSDRLSAGIRVEGLPEGHQCRAEGAIRMDQSETLIWSTPGPAQFYLVIPLPDDVEVSKVLTTLQINVEERPTGAGSDEALFVHEDGQLHILARHEVLAAFDTNGSGRFLIENFGDGGSRELGTIPLKLRFEQR